MAEEETTEVDATTSLAAGDNTDNSNEVSEHNQPGPNGSATEANWKNKLSPDLQKQVETIESVEDLVKSYAEARRLAFKPVPEMTPEEREKFHKRLGVPEKPDEYELSTVMMPKGAPKRTAEEDKAYKELVHGLSLSKDQAKGIHEALLKSAVNTLIEHNRVLGKARAEAASTLRKEWGADYDGNLRGVQNLINQFGGDSVVAYMNTGPGNEPAMLRFLHSVKDTMKEDTLVDGTAPAREAEVKPGGFDWSKVPSVSGDKRYGKR